MSTGCSQCRLRGPSVSVTRSKRKRSSVTAPSVIHFCVSFFFQAEDGIRDHCVTGVQTCALPISRPEPAANRCPRRRRRRSARRRRPSRRRSGPSVRRRGRRWWRPWLGLPDGAVAGEEGGGAGGGKRENFGGGGGFKKKKKEKIKR